MDKISEQIYIDTAEEILKNNISPDRYAICRRGECAICIEKEEDRWRVYETERGADFDEAYFQTVAEAILNMFERLPGDSLKLKNLFLTKLVKRQTA